MKRWVLGIVTLAAIAIGLAVYFSSGDDIHFAAMKGNTERVEYLLKRDPSLARTYTAHHYTPLHWAALDGNVRMAKLLLNAGASVDARTDQKETPLHLAAMKGRVTVARLLLSRGARIDSLSGNGDTALRISTTLSNVRMARLLLDAGAAVDARNPESGRTALHDSENNQITALLLAHGADPNARDYWDKSTPLILYAYSYSPQMDLLYSNGARIDAADNIGNTALHEAASHGSPKACAWLIAHGANPNASNTDGCTPLHQLAIQARQDPVDVSWMRRCARTLIVLGADPRIKNDNGETAAQTVIQRECWGLIRVLNPGITGKMAVIDAAAMDDVDSLARQIRYCPSLVDSRSIEGATLLHIASRFGSYDVVQYLIKHGANVHAEDESGFNPLHSAARSGNTQIMRLLLLSGADVNSRAEDGSTPLFTAAEAGNLSACRLLISAGGRVDLKGESGATPLHRAVGTHNTKLARLLISKGASVNAEDGNHISPLHIAIGSLETDRMLLQNGADPDARDRFGRSPLHLARHKEVLLLLKYRAHVNPRSSQMGTPLHETTDPQTIRALLLHGGVDLPPIIRRPLMMQIRYFYDRIKTGP